jgi:uncharacterized protein (DUF433 family)
VTNQSIQIVDYGRGPQIAGHRLTVMDVFYYLHRGHDFEFIHRAMPSLTREQFDAVVQYVKEHQTDLIERDRRAESFIRDGIAELKAKGLYREIDETVPQEKRIERLRTKLSNLQGAGRLFLP